MSGRTRLLVLTLAFGLVGVAVAATWAATVDGRDAFRPLLEAHPAGIAGAASLTLASIGVRFVRWRFLLRRADVRVPARADLSAYLASLAGRATPAYVGELVRALFLKRRFGVAIGRTVPLVVVERAFDFTVLALFGALVATGAAWRLAFALGALAGALAIAGAWRWTVLSARGRKPSSEFARRGTLGTVFGLSVVAWLPTAGILVLAVAALDGSLGFVDGLRIFCQATLGGALSLMPVGIGATGSIAIVELEAAAVANAVLVTTLFRLVTTGLSMGIGVVALALELRGVAEPSAPRGQAEEHFDEIVGDYAGYLDSDVWRLLIERKVARMEPYLARGGSGLDLGCGLGAYCALLRSRGLDVVGLDGSFGLLREARGRGARVVHGDALRLPFPTASLDYVYTIGVLHHLPGEDAQDAACREIARVLKPGGRLIVHESNTRNPLFRLYMGYVFPILKTVDEGTEWWIPPSRWERRDDLDLEDVEYFTFLPDFLPSFLLGPLSRLERRLERSPLRPLAVHYMAVLRRPDGGDAAQRPTGSGRPSS